MGVSADPVYFSGIFCHRVRDVGGSCPGGGKTSGDGGHFLDSICVGATFPTVLNLVMFLPLGFLLPVLWDRFRSFGRVLTAGFLCSLVLELGQLFNFRATDVEDLLMNTAGAAAGFLLWLLLMKLLRIKIRWKGLRSGSFLVRHEMEFLMIFAFLGHFFLS